MKRLLCLVGRHSWHVYYDSMDSPYTVELRVCGRCGRTDHVVLR